MIPNFAGVLSLQIAELQRASEARINSLSKPLQAEFKALGEENSALNAEIGTLQAQLEHVNAQVEAAENAMKRDRVRDEYALLDKRVSSAACLQCACMRANRCTMLVFCMRIVCYLRILTYLAWANAVLFVCVFVCERVRVCVSPLLAISIR